MKKMKVTTLDCTLADLITVVLLLGFISVCTSAPLDQYYQTDNIDSESQQRLELLKELREMISIADNNKETKQLPMAGGDTGVYNVIPQKRFRPFRTQTRAGEPGGVALCLWKVCPAAPWLVSKRR